MPRRESHPASVRGQCGSRMHMLLTREVAEDPVPSRLRLGWQYNLGPMAIGPNKPHDPFASAQTQRPPVCD